MLKLFRLKLQKEIEELKSLHRIALNEKEAEMIAALKLKQDETIRIEKDLKKENEIIMREVVSLLRLESDHKIKQLEIDKQREIDAIKREAAEEVTRTKETLLTGQFEKLTAELSKLHSEGNHQTKFAQDLALNMLGQMPERKTKKTKVLITNGTEGK